MSTPMQDPYAVLGIPRDADDQQVRDAYRRLARRHHPDRDPGPHANESMRRVNQAWDALSDPARRAAYDRAHPRAGASARPHAWASSRRPGAADPRRPSQAAWARAATAGADPRSSERATGTWTFRSDTGLRPGIDDASTGGPPWALLALVLLVAWLLVGGTLGLFLLPGLLGVLAVVVARAIFDGS